MAVFPDISAVLQTKIFSENIGNGTAAVAKALLNHTDSVGITEVVNVMVLDVRGWVTPNSPDASLTMKGIVNDADAAANKAVDGSPAMVAVPNSAAVGTGLAKVGEGVTNANGSKDMPAKEDVGAGIATAADGVKEGVLIVLHSDVSRCILSLLQFMKFIMPFGVFRTNHHLGSALAPCTGQSSILGNK